MTRAGAGSRRPGAPRPASGGSPALATAVMLVLSWPLWVGSADEFPRVPFLAGVPADDRGRRPGRCSSALWRRSSGRRWRGAWRPWFWASLGLLVVLVAQDQHRFQPWVYQYAMTSLFLAALPAGGGLRYARWWFVALYLHSGLSKLDVVVLRRAGAGLPAGGRGPAGARPVRWWAAVADGGGAGDAGRGDRRWPWALAVPRRGELGRVAAVALHAGADRDPRAAGAWGIARSSWSGTRR